MKAHLRILSTCLSIVSVAYPLHSQAQVVAAPGSEGSAIIVTNGNAITATYQGDTAGFSNDLYLSLDASGKPGDDGNLNNDLFIFNNHSTAIGTTKNLGSFTPGTELIFRLLVNDTKNNFYTGAPSRNTDGLPHARVQQNWQPGETLVSFEDLINAPEGAAGYNDLSFSFANTTSSAPVPVPAAFWLFGSAMLVTLRNFGKRRA